MQLTFTPLISPVLWVTKILTQPACVPCEGSGSVAGDNTRRHTESAAHKEHGDIFKLPKEELLPWQSGLAPTSYWEKPWIVFKCL
ncbi:hypothetical protein DPMN_120220 [Dreissena polymorpha]|uniref:Secreted protein n=1 Tax=Dreissena polymorpha TaxID=45954 RepID=A0A9D4GJS9_DREPO|nr:hypothetical protein DPMN_120220 [Dreissena polymorpha]